MTIRRKLAVPQESGFGRSRWLIPLGMIVLGVVVSLITPASEVGLAIGAVGAAGLAFAFLATVYGEWFRTR
jgi:hypothetical protein